MYYNNWCLSDYTPRDLKYHEVKNELLKNVKNFYEGREKLLKGLKAEYFHSIMMKKKKKQKWSH